MDEVNFYLNIDSDTVVRSVRWTLLGLYCADIVCTTIQFLYLFPEIMTTQKGTEGRKKLYIQIYAAFYDTRFFCETKVFGQLNCDHYTSSYFKEPST